MCGIETKVVVVVFAVRNIPTKGQPSVHAHGEHTLQALEGHAVQTVSPRYTHVPGQRACAVVALNHTLVARGCINPLGFVGLGLPRSVGEQQLQLVLGCY